MRFRTHFALAIAVSNSFVFAVPAEARALVAMNQPLALRVVHADVILIGKITEIEKDTVEGPAYPGAPKDQKAMYKVAVLKIEDSLMGAKGLTQIRVGFLADARPAVAPPVADGPPRPIRPGRGGPAAVALSAGMEGCFLLDPLPGADFYVVGGNGPPLPKKDENYDKELKVVKGVIKTIEEPIAALKAKNPDDRFRAAYVLLWRYQNAKGNSTRITREAIPAEENKLLLAVLAEQPWQPKDPPRAGEVPPCRGAIWHLVNWNEQGFKTPPATPGIDYDKVLDEASVAFLKDNMDKIKLKRAVAK